MEDNVGKEDKIVRVVLGILSIWGALNYLEWQIPLGILALILFATALTGKCGIYKVLGISTCPVKR